MENISVLKQYLLSREEIEALLDNKYGSKLQPINQAQLQKQRIQLQRQATQAANLLAKDKLAEEPDEEDIKELEEELEEIKSL